VGKRYTQDEINQIQDLTKEGLTSNEIASRLGRPEAGVRNIRYRLKMKSNQKESLKQLSKDQQQLSEKVNRLKWDFQLLQSRKRTIEKTLQIDEATLNTRLQTALRKLKDTRPELFQITIEEQIGKLTVELARAQDTFPSASGHSYSRATRDSSSPGMRESWDCLSRARKYENQ
jgi:IS30 family transposase